MTDQNSLDITDKNVIVIMFFQLIFTLYIVISRLDDGEHVRIFAIVDKCEPSLGHCIISTSYDKLHL